MNALQKILGLKRAVIQSALGLLLEMGLIQKTATFYETVEYDVHVSRESPLNISYHLVWRNFISQRIQSQTEDQVHYTAIHSLSQSDVERLREMIFSFIEETRKVVVSSPEEGLCLVSIDCVPFDLPSGAIAEA